LSNYGHRETLHENIKTIFKQPFGGCGHFPSDLQNHACQEPCHLNLATCPKMTHQFQNFEIHTKWQERT
jgi:hypothetical protein